MTEIIAITALLIVSVIAAAVYLIRDDKGDDQ